MQQIINFLVKNKNFLLFLLLMFLGLVLLISPIVIIKVRLLVQLTSSQELFMDGSTIVVDILNFMVKMKGLLLRIINLEMSWHFKKM